MSPADVWRMIRRRARKAGIKTKIGCHSFRATGITNYLQHSGTLDVDQSYCLHCQIYPDLRFWKKSPDESSGSTSIVASPVLQREVDKRFEQLLRRVP
jgi:hypothetical protein